MNVCYCGRADGQCGHFDEHGNSTYHAQMHRDLNEMWDAQRAQWLALEQLRKQDGAIAVCVLVLAAVVLLAVLKEVL